MNWSIFAVGKPALSFTKDGIAEYEKRLRRMAKVELHYSARDLGQSANSQKHLEHSQGGIRIAMDEKGELWNTEQLVQRVNQWELQGVKRLSLLIGGADGHTSELRQKSDAIWALSPLTLQHELALVVLLEQIYRCYSIKRGEPYHR